MGDDMGLKLPLAAFLLRVGYSPATAWSDARAGAVVLSQRAASGWELIGREDSDLFDAAVPGDVVMALLRRYTNVPAWQRFFRDELGVEYVSGTRATLSAALFCAIEEDVGEDATRVRWVAWAFGGASRSLRRGACDPRFGMLAALNLLVAPVLEAPSDGQPVVPGRLLPRLRELRYRATAPYVRQSGNRAARDIPVEGFRVDQSSDLISAVGGSNAHRELSASTILGGKSLQFRAPVRDLSDLVDFAETAFLWSQRNDYQELFNWIDHIRPVDDETRIMELREQLAAELIADPEHPSIDVLLPDDLLEVGDNRSIQYIAFPRERVKTHGRVTLSATRLASLVHSEAGDSVLHTGLDVGLRFYDESWDLIGSATVLECLAADLQIGAEHYITYDGDFYVVDHTFVSGIDEELQQIPSSGVQLPLYGGQTETRYNEKVVDDHPDAFVLLDGQEIRLPGERYGVEPCDLVAADGALIHVKRKGKSSKLSHLFLQAANSCELLKRSDEARGQLDALIRKHARLPAIADEIRTAHETSMQRRDGPEVVFAFLGDWRGKTVTSLPLFSRISLVHEARRVSNLGYKVAVTLVSLRET